MSRSAKGTNRASGRPSRQENISAPRLMMAELRPPPVRHQLPPSMGWGGFACAEGTFFPFGDTENVKEKCHKQLFLQEKEEVEDCS